MNLEKSKRPIFKNEGNNIQKIFCSYCFSLMINFNHYKTEMIKTEFFDLNCGLRKKSLTKLFIKHSTVHL